MRTMKVKGKLLRPLAKLVDNLIGKGISEQTKEREMLDLYKEFNDWLTYNYPGVELQPIQQDLVKMALRNHDTKVAKVAGKALIKEVAKLIVTGDKA